MADTTITKPSSISMTPILGLMVICSFLWSTAFLLMKVIGTDLSPMALTALRGIMGGVFLGMFLLVRREMIVPRGREWRDWPMLGVFQGIIPNALTAYALTEITTGLTSLIQASTPLMVAMFAHLLFADERLTPRRGLGVLTGFAGMAILVGPAAFGSGSASFMGTAAMVVTAASYAIGNLYIRGIPAPQPARLAYGQQVFSGLPSLLIVLALTGPVAFAATGEHIWALLALGVFSTALPILLYMHILKQAGPTLGSMNGYLVPVWTILLGVTLLAETVTAREIIGGFVVLAGIAIVSSSRRRRPAVEQEASAVR